MSPSSPLATPTTGWVADETSQSLAAITVRERPRTSTPLVSFVVPVHNEEEALEGFMASTSAVVESLGVRAEFVFANDGSTDRTLSTLFGLQARDPRIHIVNLSRNFGKEAALTAGLEASRGDVVVPIDADLQDPPELLGSFLDRWRSGYDVVYGIRTERSDESLMKRVSASLFYRAFNAVSARPIPRNVGDFRLLDRHVVEAILQLPERNRFMKALFDWVGFASVGVPFKRPERAAGTSSWSPGKLWNFALDGITGFSTLPLRVWTYLGVLLSLACVAYGTVILGLALTGRIDGAPGYASQLMATLFLGAVQLISLGLIGEYVGRILIEAKQRPLFIVEGTYRGAEAAEPSPRSAAEAPRRRASGAPGPPPSITLPKQLTHPTKRT